MLDEAAQSGYTQVKKLQSAIVYVSFLFLIFIYKLILS